jgi:hypothetical protein
MLNIQVGAQLLFLSDYSAGGNGVIRALGMSVPGIAGVEFGATSTALSTMKLTLGILTVDPTEAGQTITAIRGLPSFTAFAAYVATRPASVDLVTLAKEATFITLRAQVVADFQALTPVAGSMIRLAGVGPGSATVPASVTGSYTPPTSTASAVLTLSNWGLRFMSVIRESRQQRADRCDRNRTAGSIRTAQAERRQYSHCHLRSPRPWHFCRSYQRRRQDCF